MKLDLLSVCQVFALSLCCVLLTARECDGQFVPGRCTCPTTQKGVRGRLKDLMVIPKGPSCDKNTVIVVLMGTNRHVCLDPEAPMGKQLLRCWKRSNRLGRDTNLCLRRRRREQKQQGSPQRTHRGQGRRSSSSQSS